MGRAGYGRMYHDLFDAPVVILRPFKTYGPGQALTKLIPSVTLALLRGERPKVSSGTVAADSVYITDVVDGFIAAATAPGIEGETIDLGTGTLVPMRTVVDRIVGIVGGDIEPDFGALPDRPNENTTAANAAAATKYLGWRARTSLEVMASGKRSSGTGGDVLAPHNKVSTSERRPKARSKCSLQPEESPKIVA
jgi:nucleoside-diphosphate-sugar epimerase